MRKAFSIGLCLVGTVLLAGCPPAPQASRTVFLLSGDADGKSLVKALLGDKADVDVDEIEDFFVTVSEISLDGAGGPVIAFSGSMEVNLLDLTGVSQVITDAEIAPGTYTKIRISIDNPTMYLKEDPETAITDIHLTANGRLFVSQAFEIPEGQTSLILLDFDGLKLVQQGNGGYTLTPQLKVDLSVVDATVVATGTVVSNDTDTLTLVVDIGDSELTVSYEAAQILITTSGDLVVGASVQVDGLLQADGSVEAVFVTVLP